MVWRGECTQGAILCGIDHDIGQHLPTQCSICVHRNGLCLSCLFVQALPCMQGWLHRRPIHHVHHQETVWHTPACVHMACQALLPLLDLEPRRAMWLHGCLMHIQVSGERMSGLVQSPSQVMHPRQRW